MRLIPVKHYLLIQSFLDKINIYVNTSPVRKQKLVTTSTEGFPTCSGEAIFRGMGCPTCSLSFVIAHVKGDGFASSAVVVGTTEIIIHTKRTNNSFLNG